MASVQQTPIQRSTHIDTQKINLGQSDSNIVMVNEPHMSTSVSTSQSNNDEPPPIPHITTNMVPLNIIVDRVALDTYTKFREFFKYMESSTQPDVERKKQFLDMLVLVRENFVKLYVLCKWAKSYKEISKLIDLFVWLREQNERITHNIMSFGSIKSSLISAKMPEPDLLTSLEVLLQGRPNLPTYNFIEKGKMSPEFVLKAIKNLDVELSIKMSLLENIPKPFKNFKVKNGCIHFDVPNYFSCSLSMLSDSKFQLIDVNLGFKLESKIIKKATIKSDPHTLHNIQQHSNAVLESNGLDGLYDLLYSYALTSKINLIHKQLVELRMGLWRGNLVHNYNSESSTITITYWVQRKYRKASTIEIGKFINSSDLPELGFKWFKDGVLDESHQLKLVDENDGSINILSLLNNIIKKHIQTIIFELKQSIIDSIEDVENFIILSNNSEKLTFKISQFKFITYSVDSLTGSCYFENPSNTMNRSAFRINKGNSLNFVEILKLKMLINESEFSSMMSASGWVNLKSIRLSDEEILKLKINYSNLKNKKLRSILTSISIYRRKDWPIGWAVFVGNFGFQSNVQLWCCKIRSREGQWCINWCNEIGINELNENTSGFNSTFNLDIDSNEQQNQPRIDTRQQQEEQERPQERLQKTQQRCYRNLSYDDLVNLVKISSSKLISNLIVKELKGEGCELKVLNSSDKLVKNFLLSNFNIDNSNLDSIDNAALLIKNKSFFHIQSSRDSLLLLISIKNSDLNAKIYGQLNTEKCSWNLPDIDYNDENNTHIEYNSKTNIFKIESEVDLSRQLGNAKSDIFSSNDGLILSNLLSFLKKFAKTLNLLKLISSNPDLTIIKVLSNGVTFKYGEYESESISLIMSSKNSESTIIEFPKENPHASHSEYLNEIISNGPVTNKSIKELVSFLTLTLPYCRKIQELGTRKDEEWKLFNKCNEAIDLENNPTGIKLMPSYGFIPSVLNIESLRILYFKSIQLDVIQTTGKKKTTKLVNDFFQFEIIVELRHKINVVSKKHSKFYITLGDMKTNTTGSIQSISAITDYCGTGDGLTGLVTKTNTLLSKYFKGENFPVKLKSGAVIFLQDSMCCDFDSIVQILDDLHSRLYEIITTEAPA